MVVERLLAVPLSSLVGDKTVSADGPPVDVVKCGRLDLVWPELADVVLSLPATQTAKVAVLVDFLIALGVVGGDPGFVRVFAFEDVVAEFAHRAGGRLL